MSDVTYELYPGVPAEALRAEVTAVSDVVFGPDHRDLPARLEGRPDVLVQLARVDGRAVGYKIGYGDREQRYLSWLGGVLPDFRRRGVAGELMRRQHAWAGDHGYTQVTMATQNRFRGMLLLAIREGFDVYGIRLNSVDQPLILLRKDLGGAGATPPAGDRAVP